MKTSISSGSRVRCIDDQINKWNFHSCLQGCGVDLSSRAGTPATMVCGATSRVTTLPAPTMAPSPIVTPHRIVLPVPMEAPRFTVVGTTSQSASVCSAPSALVTARKFVVDEGDVVTDENIVLDLHTFANESVAGDLYVSPYRGILLNLDERPDLAVVADRTAVQVHEGEKAHVLPEPHVGCDAAEVGVRHLETDRRVARQIHLTSYVHGECRAHAVAPARTPRPSGSSSTSLPAMLHRSGGTLEQAHDLQSCPAAGDGLTAGLDAVDEVLELNLERLGDVQLRGEHIARAVTDHGAIDDCQVHSSA